MTGDGLEEPPDDLLYDWDVSLLSSNSTSRLNSEHVDSTDLILLTIAIATSKNEPTMTSAIMKKAWSVIYI